MSENEHADLLSDVEPAESWLISLSRELGRTFKRGKNGIDLLVDAAGSALKTTTAITKKMVKLPIPDRNVSSGKEALCETIASKVAECPSGDCSLLKDNVEFWELVEQLRSLTKEADKTAAEEHSPT